MLYSTLPKCVITLSAIFSILSSYQVSATDNVWYPKDPNEAPPGTDTNKFEIAYTIDDLTEEFLEKNMLCTKAVLTNCLFYTASLTERAMDFVKEDFRGKRYNFKQTIWDTWPDLFYSQAKRDWNPFRNVIIWTDRGMPREMYDKLPKKRYFERMSMVYARHCRGTAGLMTKDVKNIPFDGIWHLQERVELMKEKANKWEQVDQIDVMDENGQNREPMWIRPANGRPVSEGFQPNYPNGLYKDQPSRRLKIRGDSSYRD